MDEIVKDKRGYLYPVLQETKSFHSKIQLCTPVNRVERTSDGKFIITTAQGNQHRAKFVLVTVSNGVLQTNGITFSPALPPWKVNAISLIPIGHYCKIFFRFCKKFWPTNRGYILLASQFRGSYVHWQNLDKPGLFEGKKILLLTLTGQMCKKSHYMTDEQIIKEAVSVLKQAYPNARR